MKRASILMLGALLALALSSPVAAKTTKVPVAFHEVLVSVLDPGQSGVTGSVQWVRDMVWLMDATGDPLVAGPETLGINYDLDLATGSGELWGKLRLDPTAYPNGHFDCTWSATFVDYAWTGRTVCHGDGSLTGRQLRLEVFPGPGGTTSDVIGYTFVPGDRE